MITTATEPCWVVRNGAGHDYDEGEGVPHHEKRTGAEGQLLDLLDGLSERPYDEATAKKVWGLHATVLDGPCSTAACDGCGVTLPDLDAPSDWPNREHLERWLRESEWTVAGEKALCSDCATATA